MPKSPAPTSPKSTAQRGDQELGRDVLTFQRMDGVAENFHTEQNRDLLEKLSSQTGGSYWRPQELSQAAQRNPVSEAGITMRETKELWNMPAIFLLICFCCGFPSGCCAASGGSCENQALAIVACSLLFCCPRFPHARGTYYVTVAGLGGEPDYEQRFTAMAKDLDKLLKASGSEAHVYTLTGADATRAHMTDTLTQVAQQAKPEDDFVLILIGHGTYRRRGVQIQSPRPGHFRRGAGFAVRPHSFQAPVDRQHHQLERRLDCRLLQKAGRAVITATKTGTEKNATVFARYWVEALQDPTADLGQERRRSAPSKPSNTPTARPPTFTNRKSAWPPSTPSSRTRAKASPFALPPPIAAKGVLLSTFTILRMGAAQQAANDPAKRELLAKKEELEQKIDVLKYQKAAMAQDDYKKQLTDALAGAGARAGGTGQVTRALPHRRCAHCMRSFCMSVELDVAPRLLAPPRPTIATRCASTASAPKPRLATKSLTQSRDPYTRAEGYWGLGRCTTTPTTNFAPPSRSPTEQRDVSRPLGPPASRALQQHRCRRSFQGSARSAIRKTRRPISAWRSSAPTASTTRRSSRATKALELDPKLVEAHELMANLALEDSDTEASGHASRRGDQAFSRRARRDGHSRRRRNSRGPLARCVARRKSAR